VEFVQYGRGSSQTPIALPRPLPSILHESKWGPINNRRWWGEDNVHLSFPFGYKLTYFSFLFLVESSAFGFTKFWAQYLYRVVVGFCTVPY